MKLNVLEGGWEDYPDYGHIVWHTNRKISGSVYFSMS